MSDTPGRKRRVAGRIKAVKGLRLRQVSKGGKKKKKRKKEKERSGSRGEKREKGKRMEERKARE